MTCVCTRAGTMAMNAPVSVRHETCLLFILSSAANAECAWLRQLLSPASGSSGSGKTNDVGHLRPGRGLFLFVCGDMTLRCLGLGRVVT